MTKTQPAAQSVPVQIHQRDAHIILAAPMPGLEPQDISILMVGDKVTIHGSYRGSCQEKEDILVAEWIIGPYTREVVLPQPVNGPLTNATYGNGVLVLAMSKAQEESADSHAEFHIEVVQATLGQHIGHTGSELRPTTIDEHRRRMEAANENLKTTRLGLVLSCLPGLLQALVIVLGVGHGRLLRVGAAPRCSRGGDHAPCCDGRSSPFMDAWLLAHMDGGC